MGRPIHNRRIVVLRLVTRSLGIFEFGDGWRGSMSVMGAARTGARTASSLGKDVTADQLALSSLRASLDANGLLGGLELVLVYRSSTAAGTPPTGCAQGTAASGCNRYTGDQVRALIATDFSSTTGCLTSTPGTWCPSSRVTAQSTAEYLGVQVRVRQDSLTRFFGVTSRTITRTVVMRLEPS